MNNKQQQIIDRMDKAQKNQKETIEELKKMLTQEKQDLINQGGQNVFR